MCSDAYVARKLADAMPDDISYFDPGPHSRRIMTVAWVQAVLTGFMNHEAVLLEIADDPVLHAACRAVAAISERANPVRELVAKAVPTAIPFNFWAAGIE